MSNTIQAFIRKNHIRLTDNDIQFVDRNPYMADDNWQAHHYKITLRATINGKRKQYTTYFSQGYGIDHDPRPEDVLDCLASDASGVDNARNFEDWASEYGYDTDSRKAEIVYRNCERESWKLVKFLGRDAYRDLLEAERL